MESAQIRARIALGNALIAMLEKDTDPRAAEVARILVEQRAALVERLEIASDEVEIASSPKSGAPRNDRANGDVVVGLKTLRVKAKRL